MDILRDIDGDLENGDMGVKGNISYLWDIIKYCVKCIYKEVIRGIENR